MLAGVVMSARTAHFTPAEVQFLFPAPLSRRQLLLYHLWSRLPPQLLSGAFFWFLLRAGAGTAIGSLAAALLFMVFAQVVARAAAQALSAVASARPRVRLVAAALLLGVLIASAGAAARAVVTAPPRADPLLLVGGAIRWLALPTWPFVELFIAPPARVLVWLGACLGMVCAALVLRIRMDVVSLEAELAASQRLAERLRRARGAGTGTGRRVWSRWVAVPEMRVLGGAAPLARRQLLELARAPGPVGGLLMLVVFWLGIALGPQLLAARSGAELDWSQIGWMAVAVATLAPALLSHLPFDFRRDVDRMAYLKMLPLSPRAMVVGQLVTPALVLFAVQAAALAFVQALTGILSPTVFALLLLALPAIAWASVATDNALFLAYPYRFIPGQSGNGFSARIMFLGFLKLLVLLLAAGVGALIGAVGGALAGSHLVGWGLGVSTLAGACVPLTLLVEKNFRSFDVSRDVPP